ncbi:hypothetical protein N4Q63_19040 [Leclercia adecarboxylata]|uniref:Uncharacterized protein n=1 Tax=Leclercia adecarboxylata TaxID=83655 RepID=A0A482M1C2_9ENTR|nr:MULTISPECIES: hypothetical protein [Enterobacteriaceae]MBZ3802703.1 hypothetical protein [Leclercia adecarboxylata]MBZ3807189.1 hypothetical protein [Leclercia adecarboxylata]MDC6624173.1 hypothetical protein [Leclercia adecarboxylata]MDC6635082.1 hypothetical protein [Leclercia adecarboxylata]MDC6641000.1 hypothetical protein [Leclercia adecarboxylata]
MRNLRLFFKSLFSSKDGETEDTLKGVEEDSSSPTSTHKELRTELETDMEEFMALKSTNFVGLSDIEVDEIKRKYKERYARKGLDFLLKRLNDSPEAQSLEEAVDIINNAIGELNKTYPLDWSINPSISKSNGSQIVITLISHNLIIDKNGAFRIIDTKNGNNLILSKKSKV